MKVVDEVRALDEAAFAQATQERLLELVRH
jgi:hypothetical protein